MDDDGDFDRFVRSGMRAQCDPDSRSAAGFSDGCVEFDYSDRARKSLLRFGTNRTKTRAESSVDLLRLSEYRRLTIHDIFAPPPPQSLPRDQ